MSNEKLCYVYILAKGRNSTFYTGFSADFVARVQAHKIKAADGYTKKYDIDKLVCYETHNDRNAALLREKQLKKWHRTWKMRIIEEMNPKWEDLYERIPT